MQGPSSSTLNMNNPGVRRLMKEYREMQREMSDQYKAVPLDDNIFEWHFTIRGPKGTDFEGGVYHGRIMLPSEYPFKPPDFMFLTPNGRFEVGKKICLTVSAHHPEHWQPSWSIRTALLAIITFMPSKGEGAIGAIDYSKSERQDLAKKSHKYTCEKCGSNNAAVWQYFETNSAAASTDSEKDAQLRSSLGSSPISPGTSPLSLSSSDGGRASLLASAPPANIDPRDVSFTLPPTSPLANSSSAAAAEKEKEKESEVSSSAAASTPTKPPPPSHSQNTPTNPTTPFEQPNVEPGAPPVAQITPAPAAALLGQPQQQVVQVAASDDRVFEMAIRAIIFLIIAIILKKAFF